VLFAAYKKDALVKGNLRFRMGRNARGKSPSNKGKRESRPETMPSKKKKNLEIGKEGRKGQRAESIAKFQKEKRIPSRFKKSIFSLRKAKRRGDIQESKEKGYRKNRSLLRATQKGPVGSRLGGKGGKVTSAVRRTGRNPDGGKGSHRTFNQGGCPEGGFKLPRVDG